MTKNALQHAA